MSIIQQTRWGETIKSLKEEGWHIWFSRRDGWAWLSYKQHREKITADMTSNQVSRVINKMK